MKKIIAFTLALAFFGFSANAQTSKAKLVKSKTTKAKALAATQAKKGELKSKAIKLQMRKEGE